MFGLSTKEKITKAISKNDLSSIEKLLLNQNTYKAFGSLDEEKLDKLIDLEIEKLDLKPIQVPSSAYQIMSKIKGAIGFRREPLTYGAEDQIYRVLNQIGLDGVPVLIEEIANDWNDNISGICERCINDFEATIDLGIIYYAIKYIQGSGFNKSILYSCLGQFGGINLLNLLMLYSFKKNSEIKKGAILGLGYVKSDESYNRLDYITKYELGKFLDKDKTNNFHWYLSEAFANIKNPNSFSSIVYLHEKYNLGTHRLAFDLQLLKDPRALSYLKAMLDSGSWHVQDNNAIVDAINYLNKE